MTLLIMPREYKRGLLQCLNLQRVFRSLNCCFVTWSLLELVSGACDSFDMSFLLVGVVFWRWCFVGCLPGRWPLASGFEPAQGRPNLTHRHRCMEIGEVCP